MCVRAAPPASAAARVAGGGGISGLCPAHRGARSGQPAATAALCCQHLSTSLCRLGCPVHPAGPVYYRGRYHMFYQHLPNACEWAFGIVSAPARLGWQRAIETAQGPDSCARAQGCTVHATAAVQPPASQPADRRAAPCPAPRPAAHSRDALHQPPGPAWTFCRKSFGPVGPASLRRCGATQCRLTLCTGSTCRPRSCPRPAPSTPTAASAAGGRACAPARSWARRHPACQARWALPRPPVPPSLPSRPQLRAGRRRRPGAAPQPPAAPTPAGLLADPPLRSPHHTMRSCVLDSDGTPVLLYTGVRLRSNTEAGPLPPPEHDLGMVWVESQMAAVPEDPGGCWPARRCLASRLGPGGGWAWQQHAPAPPAHPTDCPTPPTCSALLPTKQEDGALPVRWRQPPSLPASHPISCPPPAAHPTCPAIRRRAAGPVAQGGVAVPAPAAQPPAADRLARPLHLLHQHRGRAR